MPFSHLSRCIESRDQQEKSRREEQKRLFLLFLLFGPVTWMQRWSEHCSTTFTGPLHRYREINRRKGERGAETFVPPLPPVWFCDMDAAVGRTSLTDVHWLAVTEA